MAQGFPAACTMLFSFAEAPECHQTYIAYSPLLPLPPTNSATFQVWLHYFLTDFSLISVLTLDQ